MSHLFQNQVELTEQDGKSDIFFIKWYIITDEYDFKINEIIQTVPALWTPRYELHYQI